MDQECKWGDASLIDCDVLKAVKSILSEVAKKHAKCIKEAKWGMCAKLVLKGADDQGARLCIPTSVPIYSGPHFPEFRIFRGISGFRRNTHRN
jgi:hypothetical protein